jgi:hypothetical protein
MPRCQGKLAQQPQGPLKRPPVTGKGEPKVLSRRGFRYREKFEHEPTVEENSKGSTDTVGGYANWLQGAESQECRKPRTQRVVREARALLAQRSQFRSLSRGKSRIVSCLR